jgi:NADH-quinone oxidoreductase subunit L
MAALGRLLDLLGFKYDDLAALMLVIVGVVGLCVHVFSLGYMHDDAGKARYFGGLSIFMFSMIGIVLADNLFMMFIFWELVGFSSYFLINHWFEKPAAAAAAKKAFITNRVGDFGFLLGIIMLLLGERHGQPERPGGAGRLRAPVYSRRSRCSSSAARSASRPSSRSRSGCPTRWRARRPVSALIHAATMVAAGIYMLCRIERR